MDTAGKAPDENGIADRLALALTGGDGRVQGLRRLTGGANRETWAFEQVIGESHRALILRRGFAAEVSDTDLGGLDLATEAQLIAELSRCGLPVPEIVRVLEPGDGLGQGYVMSRLEGETLAPRILRRDQYATARRDLARQCGAAMAGIHATDTEAGRSLPVREASDVLAQYRSRYLDYGANRPVFELAFRWLSDNLPPPVEPVLVHGDFRNGNLVVTEHGLTGVLDWELAHRGDPMEDLGWITVNSWRFGMSHRAVGGFGNRDDLLRGYREAGGSADKGRMRYWQLLGSLKWGIMCMTMTDIYRRGIDRSVERLAIGRRVSEAEIDMMNFIRGRD